MARGFADGTIILTNMTNQSTTCVQRANGKPISALAFSPQKPLRLACAHSNGLLTAWSIQSNQINEIKHLPPDREYRGFPPTGVENIRALAWSPDNTLILVCYEYGYLFGWSPISGGQKFRGLGDGSALPITFAVFSPDSRALAYYRAADGLCHIWNVEQWAPQATLQSDARPRSTILGAQFEAAPGRRIVTWDAQCARTWDTTSGDTLEVTGMLSGPVRGASFLDEGKLLIMLDESVVVWGQESDARESSWGASLSRLWRPTGPSASGRLTT